MFTYERGEESGVKGSSYHAYVLVNGERVPGYLHIDNNYQWWAVDAEGAFYGPFVAKNSAARELIAQAND